MWRSSDDEGGGDNTGSVEMMQELIRDLWGWFEGFWRSNNGGVKLVEELVKDRWGGLGGFGEVAIATSFFLFFFLKKNPMYNLSQTTITHDMFTWLVNDHVSI